MNFKRSATRAALATLVSTTACLAFSTGAMAQTMVGPTPILTTGAVNGAVANTTVMQVSGVTPMTTVTQGANPAALNGAQGLAQGLVPAPILGAVTTQAGPQVNWAAGQMPGQMYPGHMYPGQMYPGQMNPGQMYPGHMYPGAAPVAAQGQLPAHMQMRMQMQAPTGYQLTPVLEANPAPVATVTTPVVAETPVVSAPNWALYAAGSVGVAMPTGSVFNHSNMSVGTFEPTDDSGLGGSFAIGARMLKPVGAAGSSLEDLGLRVELEATTYSFELEGAGFSGTGSFTNGTQSYDQVRGGSEAIVAGFANLVAELGDPDHKGAISPYGGVGIGYGTRGSEVEFSNAAGSVLRHRVRTKGTFYQGLAGVQYGLSSTTALKMGYRFIRTPEHEAATFGTTGATYSISSDKRDLHVLETGFALKF